MWYGLRTGKNLTLTQYTVHSKPYVKWAVGTTASTYLTLKMVKWLRKALYDVTDSLLLLVHDLRYKRIAYMPRRLVKLGATS